MYKFGNIHGLFSQFPKMCEAKTVGRESKILGLKPGCVLIICVNSSSSSPLCPGSLLCAKCMCAGEWVDQIVEGRGDKKVCLQV